MKVKRRFPNFFSGYEDQKTEHEVSSKEELMEIDWIKSYKDDDGWGCFIHHLIVNSNLTPMH